MDSYFETILLSKYLIHTIIYLYRLVAPWPWFWRAVPLIILKQWVGEYPIDLGRNWSTRLTSSEYMIYKYLRIIKQ